jgi:hypothetical protein
MFILERQHWKNLLILLQPACVSIQASDCDKGIETTVESLQKWGHNNAIVIVMASTLFLPKVVS